MMLSLLKDVPSGNENSVWFLTSDLHGLRPGGHRGEGCGNRYEENSVNLKGNEKVRMTFSLSPYIINGSDVASSLDTHQR